MSNLEWNLLGTVKSLWDGVTQTWQSSLPHLLWGVWPLPARPGLKVQLNRVYLRFLPTPLFLGMFPSYLFILSSYEAVWWWRTAAWVIVGHTWNHRRTWMQSLTATRALAGDCCSSCRTHLSQAESYPIRGVFGTQWLNHLTELGTSFLLHGSGIFSKALLLCGGHLDADGALTPVLWASRCFPVSCAIRYKHWAPGGWSWIWPVVSEDHFRSWYET